MHRRLAVLHTSRSSATLRDILRACGDAVTPVFVVVACGPEDEQLANVASALAHTVLVTPAALFADETISTLRRESFSGALTFADSLVPAVDRLRTILGLPGAGANPERWDKLHQRAALGRDHVFHGRWAAVDRFNLCDSVANVGLPAVLKARYGAASAGMQILRTHEDVERAKSGMSSDEFLVETFLGAGPLPGHRWLADYLSIETVSDSTEHYHFGVSYRFPVACPLRESGLVVTRALSPTQLAAVLRVVDRALDAVDVRALVTHTEVKLTSEGPQVLEVNGRLGGYVERMTMRTSGFSPASLAVRAAVEDPLEVRAVVADPRIHAASLVFPPPFEATALLRVPDPRVLLSMPGVWAVDRLRALGPVSALEEGTDAFVCNVWIEAKSRAALRDRFIRVVKAVRAECIYGWGNGGVSARNDWADVLIERFG